VRLRHGLAFICACLAIAVGVPLLLLVNVGQELLQPSLYKAALISQGVYGRAPELAAQQIVFGTYASSLSDTSSSAAATDRAFVASVIASPSGTLSTCLDEALGPSAYADLNAAARQATPTELDQVKTCLRASGAPSTISQTVDGMPVFFWMLTESDWNAVLAALLPPEWARTQVESAIDQFYLQVESGRGNAVVGISLLDLKVRLKGPEGLSAVTQLIEAQPACSFDQLGTIVTIATSGAALSQVPVCRPPDAVLTLMGPSIQAALALLADLMPDTAQVDLTGGSGSTTNALIPAHDVLDLTRGAGGAGVALVTLLLVAAVLLGARSIGSALRWLGVPLAVIGGLGLLLAVASQPVAHGFVTDRLPASLDGSGIAPKLAALEVDSLNWIVAAFFGAMRSQAIVLLAVGLAMLAASVVARFFARLRAPSRINARSQPER
jgi:hypothetical protein